MSLRFFWIPALYPEAAQGELNQFLSRHRVLGIERQFVQQGTNSGWSIAVDYGEGAQSGTSSAAASGRPKVDYQEVLDPKTFAVFTALRSKRKELADRDSIPAYAIITNEQMAKLSQMQAGTLEDLKQVEGFGDVRIAKYGQDLLRVLADFGPAPDLANPTEAF